MNRKEWNKSHKVCPECGNNEIRETLAGVIERNGVYFDDKNKAWCEKCGWQGMRHELKPDPDELHEIKTIREKKEVNTFENKDGVVYVSVPDTLSVLKNMQNAITAKLPHQSTIDYTNSIFKEINSTIAKMESIHRNKKNKK